MGSRGPIGKRSDRRLGHRTYAERSRTTVTEVVVCRLDGCRAVVGQVRYDPGGRWCARGHAQRPDDDDAHKFWMPPPPPGSGWSDS